jgi:hypothetical protein
MASAGKPYREQVFSERTQGFAGTISDHGRDFDLAQQTTAPLNFKDTRDFNDYRSELINVKDAVLTRFRTAENTEDRTHSILLYRFLQRYHKVDPVPLTPQAMALREYLDRRIEPHLVPNSFAHSHFDFFRSLYKIQVAALEFAHTMSLPSVPFGAKSNFSPSYDRFKTLNAENKEKQENFVNKNLDDVVNDLYKA